MPVVEYPNGQVMDFGDLAGDALHKAASATWDKIKDMSSRFNDSAASAMGAPQKISDVPAGLSYAVRHPIDSAKLVGGAAIEAQGKLGQRAINELKGGQYAAGTAHAVEAAIPLAGPVLEKSGDQFASGDVAGGLGTVSGVAASMLMGHKLGGQGEVGEVTRTPRAILSEEAPVRPTAKTPAVRPDPFNNGVEVETPPKKLSVAEAKQVAIDDANAEKRFVNAEMRRQRMEPNDLKGVTNSADAPKERPVTDAEKADAVQKFFDKTGIAPPARGEITERTPATAPSEGLSKAQEARMLDVFGKYEVASKTAASESTRVKNYRSQMDNLPDGLSADDVAAKDNNYRKMFNVSDELLKQYPKGVESQHTEILPKYRSMAEIKEQRAQAKAQGEVRVAKKQADLQAATEARHQQNYTSQRDKATQNMSDEEKAAWDKSVGAKLREALGGN